MDLLTVDIPARNDDCHGFNSFIPVCPRRTGVDQGALVVA